MWTSWSHILSPLTEGDSRPKGINIILNDALQESFKGLMFMIFVATSFSCPDWKIPFMVPTIVSDKHLGGVISRNDKPIALLSLILSKP